MPDATVPAGPDPAGLAAKALRVHEALLAHYGPPVQKERRDPLSELIVTILSQNTADVNTERAYRRLRERFPTWEEALAAPVEEIAAAIRVAGLAQIKAPRIRAILEDLARERGALSLDFLADLPVDAARAYLTSLHGVGPKTAACVLLFSLHMPALPVDTHVHRVSGRLGLVPAGTTAERAHALLEDLVPVALYYPFHLLFIAHGRTICHARRPACAACPVAAECDYYRDVVLPEHDA
jgi:endonuclease-3